MILSEHEVQVIKKCEHQVDLCKNIKDDMFAYMQAAHQDAENKINYYLKDAGKIKESLQDAVKEATEVYREISGGLSIFRKELEEVASKLKEERLIEKKEFDRLLDHMQKLNLASTLIQDRMDKLEGYIKNERFHDLLKGINDLEEEFRKKAIKLVNKQIEK